MEGKPPIHISPATLALANMTLSDVEMENIVKERPSFKNQRMISPNGPDKSPGAPSAHKRVLSQLNHSAFVKSNFAPKESSGIDFSEVLDDVVDASPPSSSELKEHLQMCGDHMSGGGVAEVTFLLRAFVPEGEIADSVTAALGGIPWEKTDERDATREW